MHAVFANYAQIMHAIYRGYLLHCWYVNTKNNS